MSIFSFFTSRPDIHDGLRRFRAERNALLLDVRTPEEYREGHIPGSRNIPLDQLERLKERKHNPLYVYCWSGARSAQACALLRQMGFPAENIGGLANYSGELETGKGDE